MKSAFWTKMKETMEAVCMAGLPMFALLIGQLVLDPLVNLPFPATLALLTAALGIGWMWARHCALRNEQELLMAAPPVFNTARLDGHNLAAPVESVFATQRSLQPRNPLLFVFSSSAQKQPRAKPKAKPAGSS